MDNTGTQNVGVFIELDCLLDTRMGVLASFSEKWSKELACSAGYFKRLDDNFLSILEGFPQEDFNDTYAGRTYGHIAGRSYWTPMAKRLEMFSRAIIAQHASLPNAVTSSLTVNTYPYRIPEDHLDELRKVLSGKLGYSKVIFVSMTHDLVHPTWIKQNFTQFIMYDFDKWINCHHEALGKTPMPEVQAIHPLFMRGDNGIPLSLALNETRRGFKPVLDICPLPLDVFSFRPE